MPPIPKFPGLAKLISEAAPALAREGTESIASKTATAEEKEFLDMIRQQMAEQEAFKSEFNLPTAHGTSGEKIAQHMGILDKIELEKKLGSDFLSRSEIASKVPDLTIKEFAPHEALHGTGIYSHPYDPKELSYLGPNYKANEYTGGKGSQIIPIRVRGKKTFNFDNNIHHSVSDNVLTKNESFEKLSKLTGTPVDELKKLSMYDIEKLARRYPDDFENITFQGQIKTFKPENIRGEFAEYDPLKRKSGDYMSGIAGAGLLGGAALSSQDAEAAPSLDREENLYYSPLSSNQDVKVYRKKSDEQMMADALKNQKAEVLQALLEANAAYAKTPVDQRFAYLDAPENLKGQGEGGAEESPISPIDFITPSMLTTPAKALGKGALSLGREVIESAPRIIGNEIGELTLPQMRSVAKLMGKNPTAQELRNAAEIVEPTNIIDKEKAREAEQQLLDFVAKERHGIEHSTPGEQIIEKMEKIYEPQLPKGTGVPVVINPDLIKQGASGRLNFKNPKQEYSRIPEIVEIGDPKDRVAGLFEHEKVGHEIDDLINPLLNYQSELVPTPLDALTEITNAISGKNPSSIETFLARTNAMTLREKLSEIFNISRDEAYELIRSLDLEKYLKGEEAHQQGSKLLNIIKKSNPDIAFEDISKAGHHWRYPRNFEIQRSLDLLDPTKPVAGSSLAENLRIIKEVAGQNPRNLPEAYRLYKEKNFPNIAQLLESRNKFNIFPVDPNTGKLILIKK